eukprot:5937466-Ditylum_brightwellii.AAC.1
MYVTVEKSSSKTTWNCGLTCPVDEFYTSAMLPVWKSECPKYAPMREQGSHLGGPAPPAFWSLASNTYVGLNNV